MVPLIINAVLGCAAVTMCIVTTHYWGLWALAVVIPLGLALGISQSRIERWWHKKLGRS